MMRNLYLSFCTTAIVAASLTPEVLFAAGTLHDGREAHLGEVRQLTFGGENAEAYWSPDGSELIFQSTRTPYECDQIFRMPISDPAALTLVSTGQGRTTCGYFTADDERVIYSSTHAAGAQCPVPPDRSRGYVWPLYDTYQIYSAAPDGSDLTALTDTSAYDAEATVCSTDGSIVFTSTRDGDLELYRMNADGSGVKRLTEAPGYDGGAFFSADCSKIVWRASRPTGQELEDYRSLLAEGLVRPVELELWMANADGSEAEMCGTGIRCVGRYLSDCGRITSSAMRIETGGGIRNVEISGSDGSLKSVRVDMGPPILKASEIPTTLPGDPPTDTLLPLPERPRDWERSEAVGEGEEYRAESKRGDHATALAFEETVVHGSVVAAV